MGHYKSNLRDLEFNLFEMFNRQDVLGTGPYTELDAETARSVLDEVNRLATGVLAESFEDADRNPPVFDPESHSVTMPESFKKSFRAYFDDGEWWRLELPAEFGGMAAPRTLQWAVAELILGANPAIWMYSSGPSFARLLWLIGTPEQKKLAELAIERHWGSTMVLTEPDAGSDVGAGRTRAVRQPDGSWHIEGVKRFITSAEHDLTENILHYVLARPEGHGPGTKGLSMFVVPKYLVDPDTGALGERNGVYVTNVEKKMGLKASTTCEVTFGEKHPAIGYLVGDSHEGRTDEAAEKINDVLLPIVKGVGSERAYEVLTAARQTYGGSGFLREYPIEQYIRDAKIDSLYEGTTAIQGLDLFFRKVLR